MKNNQYTKRIRVVLTMVCILLIVTIMFLTELIEKEQRQVIQGFRSETAEIETSKTNSKLEIQAKKIYIKNKNILILVNKNNSVPDNYESRLINICNGRLQASGELYDDLKEMLKDGSELGYSFFIASAYRSKEKQQYLVNEDVNVFMSQGMNYKKALKKTLKETMPAGYSEHQTGLALDILTSDNLNMDTSQAEMDGNIWLRENCAKYGFILRYPKDKEELTQISYEPWHFRYVGKEAAEFIIKNNLVLEEFIDMVQTPDSVQKG